MVEDELISKETKLLRIAIGFNKDSVPKMLLNFISFIWMELDKIITMPKKDEVVVVSKKNWVGYAQSLHRLKTSEDLEHRWIEVLTSSGGSVVNGKLNLTQRFVMARLVDKLHATFIGR